MRCAGDGSADRRLFVLLEKRRDEEVRRVGGGLGSLRGRGTVPLRQTLSCVSKDGQGLRDGVHRGRLVQGVQAYGLRGGLRESLSNHSGRGRRGSCRRRGPLNPRCLLEEQTFLPRILFSFIQSKSKTRTFSTNITETRADTFGRAFGVVTIFFFALKRKRSERKPRQRRRVE